MDKIILLVVLLSSQFLNPELLETPEPLVTGCSNYFAIPEPWNLGNPYPVPVWGFEFEFDNPDIRVCQVSAFNGTMHSFYYGETGDDQYEVDWLSEISVNVRETCLECPLTDMAWFFYGVPLNKALYLPLINR
jgi:hypothetical protein